MSAPVVVCPMAMQQMAHPDGEAAVARACKAAGCVMIVSTMANCSIEAIAEAAGADHLWFQLYVLKYGPTRTMCERAAHDMPCRHSLLANKSIGHVEAM